MSNSENFNAFDNRRHEFQSYGLTCEKWIPQAMRKPDRHNEIELNYFYAGTMTYLFQDRMVTIPAKRLAVFWGLVPHQIISYEGSVPYFVCTIPFSQFLEWNVSAFFVERILKSEVIIETSGNFSVYDEFLFDQWINDSKHKDRVELVLLEVQARLKRMAVSNAFTKSKDQVLLHQNEHSNVEQMAIYIAKNYNMPIKMADIGIAVGLHPDYANAIFKKAFGSTLSDYILEERVAHAQRKLLVTTLSITEIAFESGFNSLSRFNAAFLRINSCTPRDYRKKNRG